jgi:putative addiction module component (TIGR02574 family)
MPVSLDALGIDRLGTDERLTLIGELWDSLEVEAAAIPITEAQKLELQNRFADHRRNPDDVVA